MQEGGLPVQRLDKRATPRRPRHHNLHFGHNRQSQRRDAQPPQPLSQPRGIVQGSAVPQKRPFPVDTANVARLRNVRFEPLFVLRGRLLLLHTKAPYSVDSATGNEKGKANNNARRAAYYRKGVPQQHCPQSTKAACSSGCRNVRLACFTDLSDTSW